MRIPCLRSRAQGEYSRSRFAARDRRRRHDPCTPQVRGVKHARRWAAGSKVNVFTPDDKAPSARREDAFFWKSGGHFVARQLLPVLAIFSEKDQTLSFNGITESEAVRS